MKIKLTLLLAAILLTSCNPSNRFSFPSVDESSSSESSTISSEISSESQSSESSSLEESTSEEISSEQPSSEEQSSEPPSSEPTSSEQPIELITPTLSLDKNSGVVSWDREMDDEKYYYVINGREIKETYYNSLVLNDRETLSVMAVNGEYHSSWSDPITNFINEFDVYVDDMECNVYFHNADIETMKVNVGDKITRPIDPIKKDHIFDNYYADPYFKEVFDFDKPIVEDTIVHVNFIKEEYINSPFFLKVCPLITSSVISETTSTSGWRFVPLKKYVENNMNVYKTVITVTGASTSNPASFLVMDGYDDGSSRNYWKNGSEDFSITSDGDYLVTFSLDTQYKNRYNTVHAKYEPYDSSVDVNNAYISSFNQLNTPVVNVDQSSGVASWLSIGSGQITYVISINNEIVEYTKDNYYQLDKGDVITVMGLIDEDIYSYWSVPNCYFIYQYVESDTQYAYAYFYNALTPSVKTLIGEYIDMQEPKQIPNYVFDCYCIDISLNIEAVFPYKLEENTVFYPRYINQINQLEEETFLMVGSEDNIITGLTLNENNFTYYEYQTDVIELSSSTTFYIVEKDDKYNRYGPYTVNKGQYKIYFSEDYLWDIDTEKESHIYVQTMENRYYFTNNQYWSGQIKAYIWKDSTGNYLHSWPGILMDFAKTNSYGQDIYSVAVDLINYDSIIFNNGSSQTVDIKNLNQYPSGTGFYITNKNSGGKYEVATYTYA